MVHEDFSIAKEPVGDGTILLLTLTGAINVHTYAKLDATLQDLFKRGSYKLILDVSNVRYVSSAGAGVLMNAFLQAQENHGRAVLIKLSHGVRDVLELLNLQHVMPVADDLPAALAQFN